MLQRRIATAIQSEAALADCRQDALQRPDDGVKISAAATRDGGPARLALHGADSQYRFYRLTCWHFSC